MSALTIPNDVFLIWAPDIAMTYHGWQVHKAAGNAGLLRPTTRSNVKSGLKRRMVQVEVDRFNKLFTRRSAAVPEAEFLVVAAQHADKIYNHAFRELLRQVSSTKRALQGGGWGSRQSPG